MYKGTKKDNLLMCHVCQTKFDKYAIEIHYLETHNDVRNENINKYEIYEDDKLRTSIKTIHEGQKDFNFDSCGKSFTQAPAGDLRNNIKIIHESHKDFKCELCGKSFAVANKLRRHIKTIHEGHKDFKCNSCEN